MTESEASPAPDEIRSALMRLLADPEIGGNARRARLLQFLVDETLAGRADRLKGTSIAIDVFGRTADFDAQADAIVRSEARRLRQALATYYVGSGARDPIVITVPKGTYLPRFERRPNLEPKSDVPAPSFHGTPTVPTGLSLALGSRRMRSGSAVGFRRVAAALVLLTCVLTVVGVWSRKWHAAPPTVVAALEAPAVIVLPFDASGEDADIQALATGITAQFISDLMRFPDFRVHSFEDSAAWNGQPPPLGPGASDKFAYAVRGVVRRNGDSLAVVVRLTETMSGKVLWSEAFTRPLQPSDLVALQAEIAGEVASKIGQPYGILRSTVTAKAVDASGAGMSSFACVMRAYAYRHTNRRDLYAPVRACLEEATATDMGYAEAWAMLAYLRLDAGRFGYGAATEADRSTAFGAARSAAIRALAIDPGNVQATKALSLVEHYLANYAESQRLARLALDLNPNDPDTLAQLGWRLSIRGDFTTGIPYLEKAIERSIRPAAWYFQPIAVERLMAGDMAGMLAAAERASLDGSSVSDALLAIAYGGLGDRQQAQEALERMSRKWPLLASDPAAGFRMHHLREDLVAAIVDGLQSAGWRVAVKAETVPAALGSN